jgi:hypothetical protein
VLACAVVRAAGCHVFCNLHLLAHTRPTPFNNPSHKQKVTPALVRCSRSARCSFTHPRGFPHSSQRLPLSGYFAHTLPPARGLTSGRPLRSPWRLA